MKTMKQLYALYYSLKRKGFSDSHAAAIVQKQTGQSMKDGHDLKQKRE